MSRAVRIIYFASVVLWANAVAAFGLKPPGSLQKITKPAFEQGLLPTSLHKGTLAKKIKGKLSFGNCVQLTDVFQNEDYTVEYTYLGYLLNNPKIHVVRKQLLHGEQYVLINQTTGCKTYLLNGMPYVIGDMLVNFNESETTDLQGTIDFWKIKSGRLIHSNSKRLIDNQQAKRVRFSTDKTKVLFEDMQGLFWSVSVI